MEKTIVQQTPPNLIGQPSVDLRNDDFNSLIYNKGYDVILERAIMCPCRTTENTHLSNCKNCMGRGWVFINPIQTKGIILNINKSTKYKDWSVELLGTASLSIQKSDRIGYMDRITIVNNTVVSNTSYFSEVLPIRNSGTDYFVFLSYKPIEIASVFVFNSSNVALTKLDEGDDYEIDDVNPYVVNITSDIPSNGVISIDYKHEIQYHVIDIPHDVRNSMLVNNLGREEQIELPVNAIIRKPYNIYEKQNRQGTDLIDNSFNS